MNQNDNKVQIEMSERNNDKNDNMVLAENKDGVAKIESNNERYSSKKEVNNEANNNDNNNQLKVLNYYLKKRKLKTEKPKIFCGCCCMDQIANENKYVKGELIGEELLTHDFNAINIVKKLIEYESLKGVLFNKAQIDSLKMIKYPRKIDVNKEIDEKVGELEKNIRKNKYEDEEIEELAQSLNEIKQNNNEKDQFILEKIKLGMDN